MAAVVSLMRVPLTVLEVEEVLERPLTVPMESQVSVMLERVS